MTTAAAPPLIVPAVDVAELPAWAVPGVPAVPAAATSGAAMTCGWGLAQAGVQHPAGISRWMRCAAWDTRSVDCPEAPAQAHPHPDCRTLAADIPAARPAPVRTRLPRRGQRPGTRKGSGPDQPH